LNGMKLWIARLRPSGFAPWRLPIFGLESGCSTLAAAVARRARRVGASGFVTGIDISRLLETARRLADRSKVSNLRFEAADAQTFPLPAQSYDLVFSRFGIMFFDDPEAAFSNFRTALRPGGRLSFVCWPAPRENPFMTIPIAAASRHIELPQPGDPEAPGPFAFADKERIKRMLSRARFGEIKTDRVIEKVGCATLDESARMLFELGPLSSILDELDDRTRRAIFEDIRSALAGIKSSERPVLDAAAWLVTAHAA
jgi:ubiquinone/menaquinone biosynthesis C-methylase UbiE